MGSVGLHHAIDAEDAFEEKWEQGDIVFLCKQCVGVVELLDVVGAVVGRKRDSGEDHLGSAGFESGDDLVEVGAGVFDAEAAKAIVAAELDDNDGGFLGEDGVEAFDAVLGCVAADALIDDAVVVTLCIEVGLEEVGVAFAEVGTVAGGEAVAETDDEGALVVDGCGRRGGCRSFRRRFRRGDCFGRVHTCLRLCGVIGMAAEERKCQGR